MPPRGRHAELLELVDQQRAELAAINRILDTYGVTLKKGARGVKELAERYAAACDGPCDCLSSGMLRHAMNCPKLPDAYIERNSPC